MKVVFHYAAGPDLRARLAALPGLEVTVCPDAAEPAFAAAMHDAEVLWHVLQPCTREIIAGARKLRLIQKIGTGVNTIDLAAAKERGIAVCNLPGTNSRAVAEMTLLLTLAALRRLPRFDAELRAGVWAADPAVQDYLGELGGRAVGLVGYGAVPRLLAPILAAMGCRVLYATRSPKPDAIGEHRPLNDLLAETDVVFAAPAADAGNGAHDRRRRARPHEAGRGADQHRPRWPGGSGGADGGVALRAARRGWPGRVRARTTRSRGGNNATAQRRRRAACGMVDARDFRAKFFRRRRELPPSRRWPPAAAPGAMIVKAA